MFSSCNANHCELGVSLQVLLTSSHARDFELSIAFAVRYYTSTVLSAGLTLFVMVLCCRQQIILLFAASTSAFRAFQPNCTAPNDDVTWVSPPSVRGTMEIIFSCFSILLICTWAIQHLSVPSHRDHYWNHKLVQSEQYSAFLDDARFNYSKLKWMFVSLMAPEYILSKSLSVVLAAKESRQRFVALRNAGSFSQTFKEYPDAPNQEKNLRKRDWSTTHGYFANMGGFILRFDTDSVKLDLTPW